jgi:hypothetical protein
LGAFGQPARGVRGTVMRAEIGFHFDYAANALFIVHNMYQIFSQQFPGDGDGVACVKAAREFSQGR